MDPSTSIHVLLIEGSVGDALRVTGKAAGRGPGLAAALSAVRRHGLQVLLPVAG